ncbi:MAG TPA: sigma factor-like helix-turn-helix DNA-binding protein [Chloroflexota bacterium]|nr:sigma factor-like helix-turn-helix DNA-binding protein [Chloroflexota bacterium]
MHKRLYHPTTAMQILEATLQDPKIRTALTDIGIKLPDFRNANRRGKLIGYAQSISSPNEAESLTNPPGIHEPNRNGTTSNFATPILATHGDRFWEACADALLADRVLVKIATQSRMNNLVFLGRLSPDPGDRKTLAEVGSALGLTRERVRQIEVRITRMLQSARRAWRPELGPIFEKFDRAFDNVMTLERADELLPLGFQRLTYASKLFLHLYGSYEIQHGHIFKTSFDSFVEKAAQLRREMSIDGTVAPEDYARALEQMGVSPVLAEMLIKQSRGIVNFRGQLLELSGTQPERAYSLLEAVGEPLSLEEIARTIDAPVTSVRNTMISDGRFCRLDKSRYGLVEWGDEAYTTIVEKIQQFVEAQGGHALIGDVIEELTSRFGVSESSVRTYCSSMFTYNSATGFVSTRKRGQEMSAHREPLLTRGVFCVSDALYLRWKVGGKFGSGTPIPVACAQAMGLKRGEWKEKLVNGFFTTFSWRSAYPAVGSRSALIRRYGLKDGDYLFIELTKNRDATAFYVRQSDVEALSGVERAAALLGLKRGYLSTEAKESPRRSLRYVAQALGLDEHASNVRRQIRMRLADRGDEDLLVLISPYGQD